MKVYEKPVLNTVNIESIDIISTSDASLDNFVANIAVANARTEVYNFNELFGS